MRRLSLIATICRAWMQHTQNFAFLEFLENVPYSADQFQMMLDIQAHCKRRHMYARVHRPLPSSD